MSCIDGFVIAVPTASKRMIFGGFEPAVDSRIDLAAPVVQRLSQRPSNGFLGVSPSLVQTASDTARPSRPIDPPTKQR